MKKVIVALSFLLIVVIILSGCAELVHTETTTVDAVIVDTYHNNMWMQPIKAGKVTTFITHPEKNCVVVEYDGVQLTINDRTLYQEYKDKIGAVIQCDLVVNYYDDDTCRRYLKCGDS